MRGTLLQVAPVLAAIVMLLALIRSGRIDREKVGLRPPVGPWLLIVMGYVAYLALLEVVSFRTGLLANEISPWHYGAAETVLRIAGIVVLTPIAEEIIFRGVLQSALQARLAPWISIGMQAVVFAACHSLALLGSRTVAFDVGQLLFEGAVLGWARARTRSLYPSMAMHAMGNSIAVAERLLLA